MLEPEGEDGSDGSGRQGHSCWMHWLGKGRAAWLGNAVCRSPGQWKKTSKGTQGDSGPAEAEAVLRTWRQWSLCSDGSLLSLRGLGSGPQGLSHSHPPPLQTWAL